MVRRWLAVCVPFIVAISFSALAIGAEPEGDEWIDLLADVDPQRDAVAGQWRKSDKGLAVEAMAGARLALPWKPAAEFDFEVKFTRHTGAHSVALIFVAGGQQASLDIDGWGQHLAGIQNIGGRTIQENATRVPNVALENGRSYTATVRVRKGSVQALLDGKELSTYRGDGSDLSLVNLWRIPNRNAIAIGAWESSTTFESIRVRTVSGAPSTPAPMPRTAMAKPKATTPAAPSRPSATNSDRPDVSSLSDEFDDPSTLGRWLQVFEVEQTGADQLQSLDIGRTRPGWLVMVPHTSSWYQDYRGVLVHKNVSGDFVATARIRVARRGGDGPPRSSFSLAGIMVRTPRDVTPETWQPGQENYVFLSLGAARDAGRFALEVKTTIDSRSNLEITETANSEARIQVARLGEHMVLCRQEGNAPWTVHRRYRRSDMPETLQVGMTVYTDYNSVSRIPPAQHNRQVIRGGNPDLVAGYDYFRFAAPEIPNRLNGRAFSDPAQITDAELLEFLGDNADRAAGGNDANTGANRKQR